MLSVKTLLLSLCAVFVVSVSHPTMAQVKKWSQLSDGSNNAEGFEIAEKLSTRTVGRSQQVVYGVAGLGILGLGTLAIFGRFSWKWFFGIIGGLLLITSMQLGIFYVTGRSNALEPEGPVNPAP